MTDYLEELLVKASDFEKKDDFICAGLKYENAGDISHYDEERKKNCYKKALACFEKIKDPNNKVFLADKSRKMCLYLDKERPDNWRVYSNILLDYYTEHTPKMYDKIIPLLRELHAVQRAWELYEKTDESFYIFKNLQRPGDRFDDSLAQYAFPRMMEQIKKFPVVDSQRAHNKSATTFIVASYIVSHLQESEVYEFNAQAANERYLDRNCALYKEELRILAPVPHETVTIHDKYQSALYEKLLLSGGKDEVLKKEFEQSLQEQEKLTIIVTRRNLQQRKQEQFGAIQEKVGRQKQTSALVLPGTTEFGRLLNQGAAPSIKR